MICVLLLVRREAVSFNLFFFLTILFPICLSSPLIKQYSRILFNDEPTPFPNRLQHPATHHHHQLRRQLLAQLHLPLKPPGPDQPPKEPTPQILLQIPLGPLPATRHLLQSALFTQPALKASQALAPPLSYRRLCYHSRLISLGLFPATLGLLGWGWSVKL
jgi:hypothetical protein